MTGAQALTGGASAQQFNWADAGAGADWAPFASWWSIAFSERAAGFFAREQTLARGPGQLHALGAWGGFAEALAFYDAQGTAADVAALPRAVVYDFANVGVFRGPWLAPKAAQTYAGFKGGNSKWNHNHLDLGSFVYGARCAWLRCGRAGAPPLTSPLPPSSLRFQRHAPRPRHGFRQLRAAGLF
jgi:hypothetical protein